MKFNLIFHRTALCLAVEINNIEIIKLLLLNKKIDLNIPYILKSIYFHKIQNKII